MNLLVRRRREDFTRHAQAAVDANIKDANIVQFQHRTDRQIQGMLVRQRIAQGNERVRGELEARKARLAALLEVEKSKYEAEIAASFESPEQVKAKLLAHARELKDQREASRRKLAEELELRRFKASSDALRSRQSALLTEKTGLDRVMQLQVRRGAHPLDPLPHSTRTRAHTAAGKPLNPIFSPSTPSPPHQCMCFCFPQEKARLHKMTLAQQDGEQAAMAATLAEEGARERAVEHKRREQAAAQAALLDAQVAAKRDLAERERAAEGAVTGALLQRDAAAAQALRAAAEARKAQAREEYASVQAFNAQWRGAKGAARGAEAAADKAALEATLAREAAEDAAERGAREAARREAARYKAEVEASLGSKREEGSWRDGVYAEEAEKQWARRQATWDAEAAARRALEVETQRVQLAQMEERQRDKARGAGQDEAMVAGWRKTMEAADAKEAMRARARQEAIRREAEVVRGCCWVYFARACVFFFSFWRALNPSAPATPRPTQ